MSATSDDRLVYLRGGLIVPVEPLLLLFMLQERGFVLTAGGNVLVVKPFQKLTADDCVAIRRWKLHLLSLLEYEAPECS
jgi:hypothetical protein